MDFKRLREYTVKEEGSKISVTKAPPTTKDTVINIILLTVIFVIPSLFLIIFGLTGNAPSVPHVIIGIVLLALPVFLLLFPSKNVKKFEKIFCFTIDERGVTITDLKGEHHIGWQDIAMFGLVNNVRFPGKYSSNHSCMYFSVENEDEYFVRKQCIRSGARSQFYGKATDTTIVLALDLVDASEEYRAFCKYIYKYCDKQKEKCFIEVLE